MATWQICTTCGGDGSHSRDLGAFTQDEFDQTFSEEGREDYFAGVYDRTCLTCQGLGKVRSDDRAAHDRHERRLQLEAGVNEAGERLW